MLFSPVSKFLSKLKFEHMLQTNQKKIFIGHFLSAVCNANILWQEPPKSNLDMVKDAFWDYVAKATQTAEDTLTQIRASQLGQDVK